VRKKIGKWFFGASSSVGTVLQTLDIAREIPTCPMPRYLCWLGLPAAWDQGEGEGDVDKLALKCPRT
jgi:hypothetical protein